MHFISRSHLKETVRKKTGGDKNTGKTAEEGKGGLSYVWEGLSPKPMPGYVPAPCIQGTKVCRKL